MLSNYANRLKCSGNRLIMTDTKGTCRGRSVLSGLSERSPDKFFISTKTKEDISTVKKGFLM